MLTLGIEAFRYAEGGLLPKWEGSFLEGHLFDDTFVLVMSTYPDPNIALLYRLWNF